MKKIRVGVFGTRRGMDLASCLMLMGAEIVALCENRENCLQDAVKRVGKDVAVFDNFEEFINYPMDAVILTNNFHEHAPYAIECFKRNIHVLSECISNGTMAEGVELIRAFEKSKSVYMLAENYPQMVMNLEMQRVAKSGALGKIVYAEGEYNHPESPNNADFKKVHVYNEKHWRNFLPRTYYVTHSLGPLMRATGATPTKVTAFSMFAPPDANRPTADFNGDIASNLTTFNDDGSVFRFTACAAFGARHNAYRLCGTKGQIENSRANIAQIILRYNDWEKPEGENAVQVYEAKFNDKDEELILKSGHGGADFITMRMFLECVKAGKQPEHPFDIYSAVAMSSVAILAHRSAMEGGKPFDIPDFRKEEDIARYENDRLSPFYGADGSEPTLPCCSNPEYRPTQSQLEKNAELLKS